VKHLLQRAASFGKYPRVGVQERANDSPHIVLPCPTLARGVLYPDTPGPTPIAYQKRPDWGMYARDRLPYLNQIPLPRYCATFIYSLTVQKHTRTFLSPEYLVYLDLFFLYFKSIEFKWRILPSPNL
jgi:hypothetical protein